MRTASLGGAPVTTSSGLTLLPGTDPQPPYDAGSPGKVPADLVTSLRMRSRAAAQGS